MPEMSGSEFLSIVRQLYPDIVRIVLTGQPTLKSTLVAINESKPDAFLLKPSSPEAITRSIHGAVRQREEEQRDSHERGQLKSKAKVQFELEHALGSVWIAFQPVVRASDMSVFAYEALARSAHPQLNSPQLLFEAAEQGDRTGELEQVICSAIARRADALPPDIQLLVNVHPESLENERIYSEDSPLYPFRDRVILEITERSKLEMVPYVSRRLINLRKLGYKLAVDDLGAGYAGLTSFAVIHPDVVKFDRELVRDLHSSPTRLQVIRSMNTLCHEMGILTIAEGIESAGEFEAAIGVKCDLLQGYFIGAPSRDLRPANASRST
jgi:EAL domain-containing protein (putative c-di-GMP-specific phosphodiesterase class I)